MVRCVMMVRDWQGRVGPGNLIARVFGDFDVRSRVAVNMAIGSTKVHNKAILVAAWINHRNEHSCAALRAVIALDRRLSSDCGKRLLSCFVDFIVHPAWLIYAMDS